MIEKLPTITTHISRMDAIFNKSLSLMYTMNLYDRQVHISFITSLWNGKKVLAFVLKTFYPLSGKEQNKKDVVEL